MSPRGFWLAVDNLPVPESPSDDMGNLTHAWLDEPRWSEVLGQWYGKRPLKLGDLKQLAFGLSPGAESLCWVELQVAPVSGADAPATLKGL